MNRRIGVLGGTFDPIHCGHIDLGLVAQRTLQLARLYVIPANLSPHRTQSFASTFHRFAMVAITVSGRSGWLASDLELRGEPPSYTAVTLQRFRERGYAAREIFFVIGMDAFADVTSWKDYPAILDAAHFVVISRPGDPVEELPRRLPQLASRMVQPSGEQERDGTSIILIDAPTADVSSSAIRQLRAEGRSIAGLVDPRVQLHIEQHGLYTSRTPGRRLHDDSKDQAAGGLHGQS